jgi:hypothetical protein
VEKSDGDLVVYHNTDEMKRPMVYLTYSLDQRTGGPDPSKIPINGNIKDGIAMLEVAQSFTSVPRQLKYRRGL